MSVSTDADYLEARAVALHELRAARRRNRISHIDLFEAFYKAYLGAIIGGLGLYGAAGWLGDTPVRGAALDTVRDTGHFYLGFVVSLAVAIALRSAGRGGPLAFELAEIRHVLMSPADRRDSLRSTAVRSLRHALFVGATAGAAAGVLAMRRLPHSPEWLASGVVFGAAVALLAYGIALVAGGLRLRSSFCDLLGVIALAWSALDFFVRVPTSPFSWIASIATWNLHFDWYSFVGLAVSVVIAFAGARLIDGVSIEGAERRSKLVGQLRFAATMQDVRTVMVIQRQLSQQHQRARAWFKLPAAKERDKFTNGVAMRRSLRGYARWPIARIVRLVALVCVMSACIAGAWAGTGALIVVGGVALWLACLDLLEPLAQETDHPDRVAGAPALRGIVHLRLLIVPAVILLLLVAAAVFPLTLFVPADVSSVLLPLIVPLVGLAIGGAAMVVTRPPYSGGGDALLPETAGIKLVWKFLVPPGLVVLGLVPVVIGRDSWVRFHSATEMTQSINLVAAAGLAFATWSIMWIRYEEQMRNTFMDASNQAAISAKKAEQ